MNFRGNYQTNCYSLKLYLLILILINTMMMVDI